MLSNATVKARGQAPAHSPECGHCHQPAMLVDGLTIYPHREDLARKSFWLCRPCEAYVGCHPGTVTALGSPANAETRRARSAAHAAFDPIWKVGNMSRRGAYAWLADALGIAPADCHIGMMDFETAGRVPQLVKDRR